MPLEISETPMSTLHMRPYQRRAIKTIVRYVCKMVAGRLQDTSDGIYKNAFLLEMATGSGKTFTIGKVIDFLIKLRNRANRDNDTGSGEIQHSSLNILVLTNRIGGVDQFRNDLMHGRPNEGKAPIISRQILDQINVFTFHSRADDLSVLNQGIGTTFDERIEESLSGSLFSGDGVRGDKIFFSTDRTASLQNIEESIPYFDIIIIDEAHNLKVGNEFEGLLGKLATHGRGGRPPLLIPITATPTNITKELFGEPAFRYQLAEYLASEYSPRVEYKVVTKSSADAREIESVMRMIEDAKQMRDYQDKKTLLKEIERKFDAIMLRIPKLDVLVDDLLTRLKNSQDAIDETILFVGTIQEANNLVESINIKYGSNIAVPYHSDSDRNGLKKLKNPDDPTRIVVAVDMLNESIDLPVVSNIVFWRGTDTARIYLQQFGRGLRGSGLVKYYDYVGSMKNFAWIGGIYESYCVINGHNGGGVTGSDNSSGFSGGTVGKFNIGGGDFGAIEHQIDLTNLGFNIIGLRKMIDDTESIGNELKRLYKAGQITLGDFTLRNWPTFARRYNTSSGSMIVTMPKALRTIIGILGGDRTRSQSGAYIVALLEGKEFSELPIASNEQIRCILESLDYIKITSADKWRQYAIHFNQNQSGEAGFILPISIHGVLKALGANESLPKNSDTVRKIIGGISIDNQQPISRCLPGEDIIINGVRYTGVSGPTMIQGIKGAVIINNARRDKIQILKGRQPRGSEIQLIPALFIEKLATIYDEGSIYEYQGGMYLAFTFSGKHIVGYEITGRVVQSIAERKGFQIITGFRNKRGTGINLIKLDDFNTIKNDLYKLRNKR